MTVDETTRAEEAADRRPTSVIPGWLPSALVALLLVVVARQGARPISDPDAFWHIRLGHDILQARSVASVTDPWSELSDQQWVPTQWLTEIALAAGEGVWGLPAAAWLFTLSLVGLVLLLHRSARRVADAIPAAFAVGFTIVAMSASLSPRPHMVTYLCLALTVLAWHATIDDLRPRWWLIPLTWLWAMGHGMWFVGPLLGLVVLAGLVADGRLDRTRGTQLVAIPFASMVVAALTPVGPALLGAPFAVAGIGSFITEWQSPSFRSPGPAAAALMVVVVVVAWSRSTRSVPWSYVALLVLAAGWIVLASRTVALGAVIMCPLLAVTLNDAVGRGLRSPNRRETWSLRAAATVVLAAVAMVVPHTAAEPAGVPSGLDPELEALGSATVFNDYALGGWLRWRHPALEPVVDGMTEAYAVDHLRDYGRAQAAAKDWQEVLESWEAEAALLPEGSPLATALVERPGWTTVGEDQGYVLLVAVP